MYRTFASLALAAALAAPMGSTALAQHSDIVLADVGGKLTTGAIEIDPLDLGEPPSTFLSLDLTARVFEGELDAFGAGDEPGFNAVSQSSLTGFGTGGTALTASTAVDFTLLSTTVNSVTGNLFFWDGTGPVNFGAPNTGDELAISFGVTLATADGSTTQTTANIDTTNGSGVLHRHLDFALSPGFTDGIYAIALSLSAAGYDESDPFYLVFATDGIDEAAHEAAVDYFINLVAIPEPMSASLLLLGSAGLLRRRHA